MNRNVLTVILMLVGSVANADADSDFQVALEAIGSKPNPKKAFEIGTNLDGQGDCRGAYILGYLYHVPTNGSPVKEDRAKAREYYLKSAGAGCGITAQMVGYYYSSFNGGLFGEKDLNKAAYWFGKAFEADNKKYCSSAVRVSEIYEQNQNYEEAYKWYLNAKNSGAKFCDEQALAKLEGLETKVKMQAEAMREDPPVAGVRLSLADGSVSKTKPKKKSKKK